MPLVKNQVLTAVMLEAQTHLGLEMDGLEHVGHDWQNGLTMMVLNTEEGSRLATPRGFPHVLSVLVKKYAENAS